MNQETIAIHHGYARDGQMTMAVPLYQSTAFEFESADQAANRFALKELGNIYTRLANPTTSVLEERIAALEGGASAVATSSGQAAIFYAVANVAESGDNIVISDKLYGGSVTLLTHTIKRFGIEARLFNATDPEGIESLIDDRTKAIFFESLSNPQISIPKIDAIVEIARREGVVTICDNTVATPALFRPIDHGVDVVVHSTSKYITGQGLAIGGIVVDRPGLDTLLQDNPRYAHFNEPDASYHGLVYTELPFPPFNLRVRLSLARDIGAVPAPFNSWLLIQGTETLPLRIRRHSENALEVAKFLAAHPKVRRVSYPGLEGDSQFDRAQHYFRDGLASGLLNFEVEDFETARRLMDKTRLFAIVVNIGDSKSIITHPASTTHQQIPEAQQRAAGITPGLIRLSIGLEHAADLIEDLSRALDETEGGEHAAE